MSESLPIAAPASNASPDKHRKQSHSSRVSKGSFKRLKTIGTAVLPALTAIAVSFIGIVPSLHRRDAQEIKNLKQQLSSIAQAQAPAKSSAQPDKKITVKGTVSMKDGKSEPLEVYFLPTENAQPTTTTFGSGEFHTAVPSGSYWIIIREGDNGTSERILLDTEDVGKDVPLHQFAGATVNYRINYQ